MKIARSLSSASTVLLKNANGILPLPAGKKIAVIGFGTTGAVVHGGGSGAVSPSYIVTPLEGIQAGAGAGSTVSFNDGTEGAFWSLEDTRVGISHHCHLEVALYCGIYADVRTYDES